METHLDKAKGALDGVRIIHDQLEERRTDPDSLKELELQYLDLLTIARTQAEVAQAEYLERIATALEHLGQVRMGDISIPAHLLERAQLAKERALTRVDL